MTHVKIVITGLLSVIAVVFSAGCSSTIPNSVAMQTTQVATSTPTIADTPKDYLQLNEQCVDNISTLEIAPDGIVVLQDEITRDVVLFDMATQQKTLFDEAVFVMAVSPDNKQLVYTEKATGQIVILASNGARLSELSVPKNWIGVVNWINSDTLLIEKFIDTVFGLASIVKYEIGTGRSEEFASNYPGITTSIPPMQWGNYSYIRTVYDQSFSRVVYPGADEQGQPLLILWDIETNREIVRFHQGYDNHIGGAPQWMRDGSAFIAGIYPQQDGDVLYKNSPDNLPYKGGFELFHVSRDGKIQRLTYLTTDHQAGEEGFSLSADEKHIAFWLNLNYEPGDLNADRKLAMLDIETGEITNLCIAGGATPTPPIWSPDGKYLIVSRYYITGDVLSDVILIDLEHNRAVEIADNVIAKGWLVK